MNSESLSPSRRHFLKAGALLLGGGVLAGCRGGGSTAPDADGQADLRIAGYPFDRVQGLSGQVEADGGKL